MGMGPQARVRSREGTGHEARGMGAGKYARTHARRPKDRVWHDVGGTG